MVGEGALTTPRAYGILVVDDEHHLRGVLGHSMRRQGFAVWLAADGHEALALYRRHRAAIDVVLLDVHMPGPDGPRTLAALRGLNPQLRCWFMSGDLGSFDRLERETAEDETWSRYDRALGRAVLLADRDKAA